MYLARNFDSPRYAGNKQSAQKTVMDQEKRRVSNKQIVEPRLPTKPFATERDYELEDDQEKERFARKNNTSPLKPKPNRHELNKQIRA